MNLKGCVLAGILAGSMVMPAYAHHSFAMFDAEKRIEIQGTVNEFVWANPHSWLKVMVSNAQGQPELWTLEMGGPAGLARGGWRPKTVVPGDKVTVSLHPLKDGTHGGQFLSATLASGQKLGDQQGAAGGGGNGAND